MNRPADVSGLLVREAGRIWRGDSPVGPVDGMCGIWCSGTTARGLLHATSDLDIVALVEGARAPQSYLIDGFRIDLRFLEVTVLESLSNLLESFRVWLDDVDEFRVVRAHMDDLTSVVTASEPFHGRGPAVGEQERAVYLRYALADDVERVHSLVEDAVGLHTVEEWDSLDIVRHAIGLRLLSAYLVSRGEPRAGDKWLPIVLRKVAGGNAAAMGARSLAKADLVCGFDGFLNNVRLWLEECLARLWPNQPPGKPKPSRGWLPQVYADGWFDHRGDVRVRRGPSVSCPVVPRRGSEGRAFP